jgi:hypothetical protein
MFLKLSKVGPALGAMPSGAFQAAGPRDERYRGDEQNRS